MAKISVHLGFTFRVGDLATNQYGRIDMSIDQIDTDLDIEEQLDTSKDAAEKVLNVIRGQVDEKLENMLDEAN